MRRRLIALLTLPVLGTLLLPAASAAVKTGATCPKLNQSLITAGYKFTCIKSGKKLVWSNGVKVTLQSLTDLHQVAARFSDISSLAFRASLGTLRTASIDNSKIALFLGPHSQDTAPSDFLAVRNVQKLFFGSNLPSNIDLFYYSSSDHDWAINKMMELIPRPEYMNSDDGPKTATDGTAIVALKYTGVPSQYVTSGALEAHEFFHTVQQRQFSNSQFKVWTMPRWWIEGGGRFVENLQLDNYDEKKYLLISKNNELTQYNAHYFSDFLDATTVPANGDAWTNSYNYSTAVVYGVGAKIQEMLVAFKGPSSLVGLMGEVATSGDFLTSFNKLYGITWSEFVPLAAQSIYRSPR